MKFSILIPSKNGEYFIENCIKSILDQGYKDYEIIIGNNNNNEVFKKIISKYKSNEKINVINHTKDITVTQNWQSCLSASKGDYIIMLGDDDCLLKDSLININQIIESWGNDSLIDGSAISIFEQMCIAQGVDKTAFDSEHNLLSTLGLLDSNLRTTEISVPRPGWIADIDAMGLGEVVLELGGGRMNLGEEIDPGVGFVLDAHVGSLMVVDETWITIYHREELSQEHLNIIENAIKLSNEPVDSESRVIEIL